MSSPIKVNLISESAFTVQGHGVHTAFTEMFEALSSETNVEVFSNSFKRADVVHIHTVGLWALFNLILGGGVKVVSAHVMPDSFVGSLIGAKFWYGWAKSYLRWFYNRADSVLAVSQEVSDQLKAIGVKRPVIVVPNTIKIDKYQLSAAKKQEFRQQLGISGQLLIVIGVGQVQPRKRIDSFIATAKKLPHIKFIWVGGIPFKRAAADYQKMNELMQNAPQNVDFVGDVKHQDLPMYYGISNLFFLPSQQETFGIVVVEAAASGLPILLRDIDQYKKTFGDNYLAGDDDSFASQIKEVFNDPKLQKKLQQESVNLANQFNSETATRNLVTIYQKLLQNKKGR